MVKRIKVAILVDEYFGGANTAFGGYGFLARELIAKYLPCDDIEVEVLLKKDTSKNRLWPKEYLVDGVKVYRLAAKVLDPINRWFLKKKNYDVFLSIELTTQSANILSLVEPEKRKVIHWIQDPRPMGDWEEIHTVKLFPEQTYWDENVYDFVHKAYLSGKTTFISQAHCLNEKARELYQLHRTVPIQYVPNPINIDDNFKLLDHKPQKKKIVFLGRIESVKRGWLFCEIAKQMPHHEFYVLGKSFRESERNKKVLDQYKSLPNLHFVGHVEGEEKNNYLKEAAILVNTSIHEALPVSFLEALSYGTLLVSCQNPDDLTSQFGRFTGTVIGDGFEKVPLFVEAINELMNDDALRYELGSKAIYYIKQNHNISSFQSVLRKLIREHC
ncbi:glycosyltransferase family 4 protein [Shewanella sp. 202IG2-18]|uniref:glycosyltransferase family 4 protein n=1 Tax=Parashewanella hymeniacidonis TaxID=2807618 RepID=UPI001960F7B4|nr:glycosyltransferase family 4 protein [Parashewanella hymeniacidonis]MBM7071094.1 glycosyltransferase family 4 protein [Parashewanella hymeniacidonis]